MKSIRLPVIAGITVAIAIAVMALITDKVYQVRTQTRLQDFLNDISLPLLERGEPAPLFTHLDEGVELISPDMGFITRYLPLVELAPWVGEIRIPSLYSAEQPSAVVSSQAHFSRGIADIRAAALYRDGQWMIRQYEVIAGPPAQ